MGNFTVGQKKPFTLDDVQLIRGRLLRKGDKREIALFETAISTSLRQGDLLELQVKHVRAENGSILEQIDIRQSKTRVTVTVSLSEAARKALADYIADSNMGADEYLWTFGRIWYSKLVKGWARAIGLDARFYSTHSMRRTLPAHIHKVTGSHEVPRQLLGHTDLGQTARYLGVSKEEAHAVKKRHEM